MLIKVVPERFFNQIPIETSQLKKRLGATLESMKEFKNKYRLYKMTKGSSYRA